MIVIASSRKKCLVAVSNEFTPESRRQAIDVVIRRLGIVIEISLDAYASVRDPRDMKGLAHQVNHFTISD